jgi:hypothetical protein
LSLFFSGVLGARSVATAYGLRAMLESPLIATKAGDDVFACSFASLPG